MSLGQNVQSRLDKLGLDQKDLAKRLKVAQSTVSDWINGKTFPRHKKLPKLAAALETTVAQLVA